MSDVIAAVRLGLDHEDWKGPIVIGSGTSLSVLEVVEAVREVTGVALAVLEKLAENGTIQPGQRTVVLSTANGLKFTDFKVKYHDRALGELGITSRYANRPVELPAELDAVKRAVERSLITPVRQTAR